MRRLLVLGICAVSTFTLNSGAQEEKNTAQEEVRYICGREDARHQAKKIGTLKLRFKKDVLFKARDINPFFSVKDLLISENLANRAKSNPADEFRIPAGRVISITLSPEQMGAREIFYFRAVDEKGAVAGVAFGDGKSIIPTLDSKDAKSLKGAIEKATGMELLTPIEDRCSSPIDVKKARDEKRSKDKLQQQQRDHHKVDEIKGNSSEAAS